MHFNTLSGVTTSFDRMSSLGHLQLQMSKLVITSNTLTRSANYYIIVFFLQSNLFAYINVSIIKYNLYFLNISITLF